jgi:diguanylate cyclase (GGDEF)-like protein
MNSPIPIRTLIIEDCDDDAMLLVNVIKKGGFDPNFIRVDDKHDLSDALGTQHWDIIFSDYTMPNFNGNEALQMVRMHDPDVPFFFVSGTIGEDRAVEAMRLGAQDYFIKGNLRRLPSAINRELKDSVQRRNHRLAEERIYHLANYDSLTGLPNRTLFTERLSQAIESADNVIGVFDLNLSRFKDINNHLGAAAGDALLAEFALRLSAIEGLQNTIARLSADEFAILVLDLDDANDIQSRAEKILATLEQPFLLSRYEWRIHASMGASLFPRDGDNCEELLANAMMALQHAQQVTSDNCFLEYDRQMRTLLQEKLILQRSLEHALERNELELHYQPQVALDSGRIIGVEALMRWQRPDHGLVSPVKFIPMAEESGLIVPMGEWALRSACKQIKQWQEDGVLPLRVAVNFSAYQFRQRHLVETVRNALHEFAVNPEFLEVEITESVLMQDAGVARVILSDLRNLGVSIALDDFGTGYSSLSYLKKFPVTLLKIDRAFVSDLPEDQDDIAIVHAIIAMADKLNMAVIAEGVETVAQLKFLKQAGCDMVQGYYLARPTAAAELLPLLQKGRFHI